jgi:hypothetical protein
VISYVNGIKIAVKKAGKAWDMSCHSTFADSPIIMTPTSIKTGAVASDGTAENNGLKNNANTKYVPITIAVNPVLPPSLIPDAVSTQHMMGVDPKNAAVSVPATI